jgi:hypothetical protein
VSEIILIVCLPPFAGIEASFLGPARGQAYRE